MAEYRIRSTGEVVTNLAAAFRNSSIPQPVTSESLEALEVDPVFEPPQPSVGRYQYVYRDGVELIDGRWFKKFSIGPTFANQQDQVDFEAQKDEEQATQVRGERNQKLSECDWTQVADAPVDQSAWAEYRQALREIPKQAGFPWEITWPTPPA